MRKSQRAWTRRAATTVLALLPLGASPVFGADASERIGEGCASNGAVELVSVADAVKDALDYRPELTLAREDLVIARASVSAAITPFLPNAQGVIDAERLVPSDGGGPVRVVGNNVVGGPQSYSTYGSVNLNWNLFSSGKDLARYRGAKADVRASEATLEGQRGDTLIGALQAYSDLYEAQINALAAAREITLLDELKARAAERYENGHGTTLAIGQASVAALDGRRTLYRSCRDVLEKSASLSRAIGVRLPAEKIYRLGAAVMPPARAREEVDLEEAIQNDPAVVAARENIAGAEQAVKQARAAFGPTVALIGRRDYLGQDVSGFDDAAHRIGPSSYRFGLSISQPLLPGLAESAEVSRARAQLRKAQATHERALAEADGRLRGALSAAEEARSAWLAARESFEDAQKVLTLTDSLFRAGRVGLDDVQHAQLSRDKAQADRDSLAARSVMADWILDRAVHPDDFTAFALQRLEIGGATAAVEPLSR